MPNPVTVRLLIACYRCGREGEANSFALIQAGWYLPYHIRQPNGIWLQTQLCPVCAPRWSLRRYMRSWGNAAPRPLHQLYAWCFGYFWLPCPRCGRHFGGHEPSGGVVITTEGRGMMTCRTCVGEYHENR